VAKLLPRIIGPKYISDNPDIFIQLSERGAVATLFEQLQQLSDKDIYSTAVADFLKQFKYLAHNYMLRQRYLPRYRYTVTGGGYEYQNFD
jgi:hypothetical protein